MTIYTMAQLEALTDGYAPSRYQNGHVTSHTAPLGTPDVRTRIYDAVIRAGGACSRADIARALGLKKTPWLLDHIERLAADGYLRRLPGAWRNGCLMYWYEARG